jgi:MFS family permease
MNTPSHSAESPRPGLLLARYAARFSFAAPFVAYLIFIIIHQSRTLSEAQTGWLWIVSMALAVCVLAFPILGFIVGAIALVATKRYGRKGIFGMAVAGTVLCGIYILIVILALVAVSNYAHHAV